MQSSSPNSGVFKDVLGLSFGFGDILFNNVLRYCSGIAICCGCACGNMETRGEFRLKT